MSKVLVVEDDEAMAVALRDGFTYEGHDVTLARDGEEGLRLAREDAPEIMILDVMLPKMTGLEVCKLLRGEGSNLPIIMLTARGQEIDKVLGLKLGADDYVTKPFSVGELLARIHAIFRRMERVSAVEIETIQIGASRIELNKHTLSRGRKTFQLSFYEVELIKLLHERLEEPVSRDEILEKIWGVEANPTNRTVDNFIVKLRRKIELDHKKPVHILTVYGMGYKLVP